MNTIKHNQSYFKSIAFMYLEGKISSADEQILFEFLRCKKNNLQLFFKWEKEWLVSRKRDQDIEIEWQRMKSEILKNKLAASPKPFLSLRKINPLVRIAALIIIILGFATIFKDTINGSANENYIVVEAPYGDKSKVVFKDGTTIWLNSGSKLTYNAHSRDSDIMVKLEGEGYFDVAKNKRRKFVVETSEYLIEVKGTKFNVTSYGDDHFISTTLIDGEIHLNHNNQITKVKPGECAIFDKNTGQLFKENVDAAASKEWIEDVVVYDDISLDELIKKLTRRYNIPIHLESIQLGDKHFSIALRNGETLSDVMQALGIVLNAHVEKRDNAYHIKER